MSAEVERSILEEARTEVGYADHKASMVLAALGIGFGALLGGFLADDWQPAELDSWSEVSWWFGAVSSVAAVACAAAAVWPRYRKTRPVQTIHYWGDVAAFSSLADLETHLDATPPDLQTRVRYQMWELCRIVRTKYAFIRAALLLGGVAVVAFVCSPVLS